MSHRVIAPTVEETLAILADRIRHLETSETRGRQAYNVKAFGARGDGAIDDTGAIQATIDAASAAGGREVYLPDPAVGNEYIVTNSLVIKPHVNIKGDGYMTRIKPVHGVTHYPLFVNDPTAQIRNFTIRDLTIDFSDCGTPSPHVEDKGFDFRTFGTNYPMRYRLDNIRIDNAYYGFYDISKSWGSVVSRVWTMHSRYGFWKEGGTTFVFESCDATGKDDNAVDLMGWYLYDTVGFNLISCASERYHTSLARSAYFLSNVGLGIDNLLLEGNGTMTTGGRVVEFNNCHGLTIRGLIGTDNHVHVGVGQEGYLAYFDDCKGSLAGLDLGSHRLDDVDNAVAGTNAYTVLFLGDTMVDLVGGRIATLSGGGALTGDRYALASVAGAGSSIVEKGCSIESPAGGVLRYNPGGTLFRNMYSYGRYSFWEDDAVDGVSQTVILDGSGDVLYVLRCRYVVCHSGGTRQSGDVEVLNAGGWVNIYDDGANVLSLIVDASGRCRIQRTAGAGTFRVALKLLWI